MPLIEIENVIIEYHCNHEVINKISIHNLGQRNKIYIDSGFKVNKNLSVIIRDNDNVISIGKNVIVGSAVFNIWGSNNKLEIRHNVSFGANNEIWLYSAFDGTGCSVIIDNNCMFSSEIKILNGDGHPIIDFNNDEKISNNPKKGIYIGEHCWIGVGSKILKESEIGACSIIGANAIVSKKIPFNHSVIGNNLIRDLKGKVWSRGPGNLARNQSRYFYFKNINDEGRLLNLIPRELEVYKNEIFSFYEKNCNLDISKGDFWRELAMNTYKNDKFKAYLFISQAVKIKPNGPIINKLKNKWKEILETPANNLYSK